MVRRRQRVEHQPLAGRVHADRVPQHGHHVGLVDRAPVLDPVPEPERHQGGVLGEAVGGLPVQPAAAVLERLRQVPVEQRGHRLHPGGEQLVDEPVVERQPLGVRPAAALGLDPRPGDGEPVAADAEVPHQRDVLAVAVVVVAGLLAAAAVGDAAGLRAEGVPHAGAAAILVDGTLDLVRRGAGAEAEAVGESGQVARGRLGHGDTLPEPVPPRAGSPGQPGSVASAAASTTGSEQPAAKAAIRRRISRPSSHCPTGSATGRSHPGRTV